MQIGNLKLKNNLILAPMAGVTDRPFRQLAVEAGCGLVVSEMVSAKGLLMGGEKTLSLLEISPEERPVAVQLFGAEAETLAEAAAIAEARGADIIDINMGCPVKKVAGTGAGAALLKDLNRIERIVGAVRKKIKVPLTVKIRSGWDAATIVTCEVLKAVEASGADALTLHPRTRSQGFGGYSDWSLIGELKAKATIPIIGNGDVKTPEDAKRMIDETGCDGVMIGRAAMGNPWLFGQTLDYMATGRYELPDSEERGETALRHLRLVVEKYGTHRGIRLFRKHLAWYSRSLRGAAAFRTAVNSCGSFAAMEELTDRFFRSGEVAEANTCMTVPPATESVSSLHFA